MRWVIVRVLFWGTAGVLITIGTGVTFRALGWSQPLLTSTLVGLLSAVGSWCATDAAASQFRGRTRDRWPVLVLSAGMAAAVMVWDVYALAAAGRLMAWPLCFPLGAFAAGVVLFTAQTASICRPGRPGEGAMSE